MNEERIPTAERLITKEVKRDIGDLKAYLLTTERVITLMQEFAKLHVAAALKAQAAQVIKCWEILPGGKSYPGPIIAHWLKDTMKPLIDSLREGTVPAHSLENIK
jgi:hypothetical protein